MMRNGVLLLVIMLLLSCSVQNKTARKYLGVGREVLLDDFGEPQKIIELKNGLQRFIYIREKYVKETEIGTGRGTLDPRISPGYIKEETFRFDVNHDGIIINVQYEKLRK